MSDEEPKINIVGDLHLEKQGGGRNNHANDVMSPDGISTCMTAAMGNGGGHVPKILEEPDPGIIVEGVFPDTKVVQARQVYGPDGVAPSCVAGEGTGSRTKILEEPRIEVAGHLDSGSDFVQARTGLSAEGISPALTTTHPGIGQPKILEESDPGQGIAEPIMCPVKSMVRVRKNPIDEQALVEYLRNAREESGKTIAQISEETGVPQTMAEHWFRTDCPSIPNPESWEPLKRALGLGETPYDKAVTEFELREGRYDQADRAYHEEGVSPALTANGPCKVINGDAPRDPNAPIMWPSLNGPTQIEDGDGVVPTRPYSVRKSVMKGGVSFGVAATATLAVAVEEQDKDEIPEMKEGDVVPVWAPSYRNVQKNGSRFKDPGEPAFTVTTVDKHGVALMEKPDPNGIPMAEGDKPIDIPKAKLRIRYLTPRECLRLMDFTDEQIDRLFAVEKSKSQLYKMAGNSIVVGVLVAIFRAIYIDETFKKPIKRVRLEDFA